MPLPTTSGVVAVGATFPNDERALSFGDHLSVSAPGWEIFSTAIGNSYTAINGTCPAVALASGIAGLLRARDNSLHVNEMRHLLELGAEDQIGHPKEDKLAGTVTWGTAASTPSSPYLSIDGPWLALDRPHYLCAGEITVALKDKSAGSSVDVTLTVGSGNDTETVTVLPLTDQGYFEGSIPISWVGEEGPAVTQDGKLDVAHGDVIYGVLGDLSAEAFVDCVKQVCNLPNEVPIASGDCDQDGVVDPGETWAMGIAMHSASTEPLSDVSVVIESDDPYVAILNDTIEYNLLEYALSYPGLLDGDSPAMFRIDTDTPFKHSVQFHITSIHGAGWENDPEFCRNEFGEPTVTVLANRDLGPEQNLWDFDDGTAQGFTTDVAHGTGDLSECDTGYQWLNDWEEYPVSDRTHSGGYAMRWGDGETYRASSDGGLSTPVFDVSTDGGAITFYMWIDNAVFDSYEWAFDGFTMEAKRLAEPVWSYAPDGTYGFQQVYSYCSPTMTVPFGWAEPVRLFGGDGEGTGVSGDQFDQQQLVVLDSFAGSMVQARFRFGSMFGTDPASGGVWVDTVAVHPWVPDTWSGNAPGDIRGRLRQLSPIVRPDLGTGGERRHVQRLPLRALL